MALSWAWWGGERIAVCQCDSKTLSIWNTGTLGLCICAYVTSKKMKEIIIIINKKKQLWDSNPQPPPSYKICLSLVQNPLAMPPPVLILCVLIANAY